MKKSRSVLIIILFIITYSFFEIIINKYKGEQLFEAKWNAPDTTLAITIDGEISTTFPATNLYIGTVKCTNGTGKVEWNGSKWILTTSGITKGSTKCNVRFDTAAPAPDGWYDAVSGTLLAAIRDNNELKTPLTTPGKEVSAHIVDDVESQTISFSSPYQAYYFTYGTGWEANGSGFNLTGTAVTSDTYANSYSSLVGKYLPHSDLYMSSSSTAGTMKNTTNLSSIYYVVSATSSSYTYKLISSNKNTTEALIASTEDDYGKSYYFRGAVKNNYVEFANKCWRVVRITGDGSVKLVLHNNNTSGASNPCSSANNSINAAFAVSSYGTYFNSSHNDNTYVGFMYGATGASDYASTHANTNKSSILKALENWYSNNLTSYESKLADTIWCNDKTNVTDTTYNPGNYSNPTGLGYGTNKTYYGATKRLVDASGNAGGTGPSLKCPNDNNGGKLSKFTAGDTTNGNGNLTYKVGLLTADEIAFAGSMAYKYNHSTYLQENTGNWWWSLSPVGFGGSYAYVWLVCSGSLWERDVDRSERLRPAISLVSSTTISGGSGTSEDPYVVKS